MSNEPICVKDFELVAKRKLAKNAFDYYSSGADAEQTLKENTDAFKRLRIRPRMLRDVGCINLSTSILGSNIKLPICIAPTAMQKMAHPDGEMATARAAEAFGTCMSLSSFSTSALEDVADAAPCGLKWFQLYVYKDQNITRDLVKRVEMAGYKAIVVTIDTPVLGQRFADFRNKFALPSHLSLANFNKNDKQADGVRSDDDSGLAAYVKDQLDPSLSWKHIEWLKTVTSLPVVIKGVLTKETAIEAAQHGIDGIVVSNHGGRQLDGVTSTIDALPEIVKAVSGKMEIYIDGGIRHGTDVLKALALGAKAVFVGRPVLWGLAYNGENGVKKVLQILRDELQRAMALTGCRSIEEITRALVAHERRYLCKL